MSNARRNLGLIVQSDSDKDPFDDKAVKLGLCEEVSVDEEPPTFDFFHHQQHHHQSRVASVFGLSVHSEENEKQMKERASDVLDQQQRVCFERMDLIIIWRSVGREFEQCLMGLAESFAEYLPHLVPAVPLPLAFPLPPASLADPELPLSVDSLCSAQPCPISKLNPSGKRANLSVQVLEDLYDRLETFLDTLRVTRGAKTIAVEESVKCTSAATSMYYAAGGSRTASAVFDPATHSSAPAAPLLATQLNSPSNISRDRTRSASSVKLRDSNRDTNVLDEKLLRWQAPLHARRVQIARGTLQFNPVHLRSRGNWIQTSIMLILLIVVINVSSTTGLEDHTMHTASRVIREAEEDLRQSAQLSCSSDPNYTSISVKYQYKDFLGRNEYDYVLQARYPRSSTSILADLPENIVDGFKAMPVTLTGTNIGLAIGMTGNVSKAAIDAQNKYPAPYFLPTHPRQNGSFCAQMSQLAEQGLSSFYNHMREEYKFPSVTLASNAVVHDNGYVAQECGWLQTRMGCANRVLRTARLWRQNITSTIKTSTVRSEKIAWQSATTLQQALGGYLPIYDEVFVIDVAWDFNYHHFLVDSLTRLIPFYHYLRRHEHIKIHIREEERFAVNISDSNIMRWINESKLIRHRVLDLLEISTDRVVSGLLIARKVYLPSEPECSSFFKNALALRLLSQVLQRRARRIIKSGTCDVPAMHRQLQAHSKYQRRPLSKNGLRGRAFPAISVAAPHKVTLQAVQLPTTHANVVIQWRSCAFATPSNETRTNWRCFTDTQRQQLERAAEEVFPHSNVVLANTSLSTPLACDIALYRSAHVVIGLHGAAMTNAMFMRPGTVLVEIVGEYDRRMPPVCGFYGPFAAVFGVHHFIYYYNGVLDADSLNMADVLAEARKFCNAIRMRSPYTEYSSVYGRFDFNTTIVKPA